MKPVKTVKHLRYVLKKLGVENPNNAIKYSNVDFNSFYRGDKTYNGCIVINGKIVEFNVVNGKLIKNFTII
jgi:hypothetical protein